MAAAGVSAATLSAIGTAAAIGGAAATGAHVGQTVYEVGMYEEHTWSGTGAALTDEQVSERVGK